MVLLLLEDNKCAKLFLKSMHKRGSFGLDKLNLLPLYHLTFKSDLDLQSIWTNVSSDTATPQGDEVCQIILISIHKCRSYGPDMLNLWPFYIIWPSSVTLIFNLPEQMFQINNLAKLFWNPCINLGYGPDKLNLDHIMIWTSSVTLTYLNKCFQWHFNSSKRTFVPNYLEIHA